MARHHDSFISVRKSKIEERCCLRILNGHCGSVFVEIIFPQVEDLTAKQIVRCRIKDSDTTGLGQYDRLDQIELSAVETLPAVIQAFAAFDHQPTDSRGWRRIRDVGWTCRQGPGASGDSGTASHGM